MNHALFIFKAVAGKPSFAEQSEILFRQHMLDHEGAIYEIHQRTKKRTLSQNKLYWLFLEHIENETGNNADYLHELFRRTLLPPKFITVLGKEIKIPMSTTELNSYEFRNYMDKISAESCVEIPDTEDFKRWRDSAPLVGETYKNKKYATSIP